MPNNAGDLQIEISADTTGLEQGAKKAVSEINKMNKANAKLAKTSQDLEKSVKKLSSALGG